MLGTRGRSPPSRSPALVSRARTPPLPSAPALPSATVYPGRTSTARAMHGEPDIPIHPVAEGDVPSGSPSTGSYFGTLNTDPSTSFEPVAATLLSPRSTAPFKTGPASTAMRQSTSGETLAPSFLPLDTTLPNIIRFHPKESPSGDEDEEEEEEERTAPAAGRSLKKRKSVVSLRNAHAVVAPPMLPRKDSFPQYNGGFGTMSGMGEGEYGGLAEDEDKDKGRRKIQIEYIEEKSKRHITFSKRKAGIMKKVSCRSSSARTDRL